jgi:hypothetical protein
VAKNPLFPGRTNIVQTVKGFSECDLFTILYDLCTGIHVNCDNFNLRIKKRYIQCYLVEARCVYFWEGGGFPILPPPLFQNQAETDSEHSTHSAYSITAHPLHTLSQHTLCILYHNTLLTSAPKPLRNTMKRKKKNSKRVEQEYQHSLLPCFSIYGYFSGFD